jgi:hypothetical protein
MNRRMPNGTSVWCGRTAGVIPPPTRSIQDQGDFATRPSLGVNFGRKSGIVRSESKGCCTFFVAIGLISGLLLIFPQVN